MTEELNLEALKRAYDYVLDKDMKGGKAVEVGYEQDCILFQVKTCSMEFANSVLIPELEENLPRCQVLVEKYSDEEELGVTLKIATPKGWAYKAIAEDAFLEDLRQKLGPELAYRLSLGVAKAALEAGGADR